MPNSVENLEKLSYAVTSLNDDALGMHELVQRGASSLEETIEIERSTSKKLEETSSALLEVAALISSHLELIDKTSESVRIKTVETLEMTAEQIKSISDSSQKTFEEMFESLEKKHEALARDFTLFEERSLRETQEGRSDIQADILNHRTAISARIDNLENEVVTLKKSIHGFDEKLLQIKEEVKASARSLLFVGVGILVLELASISISIIL